MTKLLLAALLPLLSLGAAVAETKKFDRADTAAKLKSMFPSGHRDGQEGVMKIGGNFRSVGRHRMTWQQCRDLCVATPSDGTEGCALWTYIKADDPKMPNVCRMWWTVPELRANSAAVSGAGKVK
jgi:hypothetical protein